MSEDPGTRWDRAIRAAISRDHEAVRKDFPFLVKRVSSRAFEPDVGDWLLALGLNQLVLDKTTKDWITDTVIVTHAFRYEDDALAFKLRFKCE